VAIDTNRYIQKNWFGYGATSLYAEYGIVNNTGADITNATGTIKGRDYTVAANTTGFTPVRGVTSTQLWVWGAGIAQDFNAGAVSYFSSSAHTTVYLGYRHYDADIRCADHLASATCSGAVPVSAGAGSFTSFVGPNGPQATMRGLSITQGFMEGMRDLGYIEGDNVYYELRTAEGKVAERVGPITGEL
jgi:hypothetical protein